MNWHANHIISIAKPLIPYLKFSTDFAECFSDFIFIAHIFHFIMANSSTKKRIQYLQSKGESMTCSIVADASFQMMSLLQT